MQTARGALIRSAVEGFGRKVSQVRAAPVWPVTACSWSPQSLGRTT